MQNLLYHISHLKSNISTKDVIMKIAILCHNYSIALYITIFINIYQRYFIYSMHVKMSMDDISSIKWYFTSFDTNLSLLKHRWNGKLKKHCILYTRCVFESTWPTLNIWRNCGMIAWWVQKDSVERQDTWFHMIVFIFRCILVISVRWENELLILHSIQCTICVILGTWLL